MTSSEQIAYPGGPNKKDVNGIRKSAKPTGKMSERERLRMLRAFDKFVPAIPPRDSRSVQRELREIRRARRSGGRNTPSR